MAGAVLTAFAAIFLIFMRPTDTRLVLHLENADTGRMVLSLPVNDGDGFIISYIHSVNISPVREIFEIKHGRIILTALEFYTFGAGIEAPALPAQTLINLPGGGMRIDGFLREVSNLRYMVGYTSELTLHFMDDEIPLVTLVEPGVAIMISVQLDR